MKRLKKLNGNEYNYKDDLNWRDDGNGSADGQGIEDPSINDFMKGYKIDPYEFRTWAKSKKGITKKAWTEIDVLQFSPEYLADKILKLWNSADGLLQNFYDAFTIRYNNNLKIAIADELKKQGYTVYPLLIEDKPIYAKHKSILKKIMANQNVNDIKAYIKAAMQSENKDHCKAFKKSLAVKELMDELEGYENEEISYMDFSTLADYYSLIYPKDYAISLVKGMSIKDERGVGKNFFNYYQDFCMGDDTLSIIEKRLSGNQDPISFNDGGVNGYDFNSDSRYDTTAPNAYEVNAKKKRKLIASEIGNIPIHLIIDEISRASRNVSILLDRKLSVPPIPIKTIRKNDNNVSSNVDTEIYQAIQKINKVEVNEIWKVFLEDNEDDIDEIFVIISADAVVDGYKKVEWNNVRYEGFFTTLEEAKNQIVSNI